MSSNSSEIVVRKLNLFVNSEDRAADAESDTQFNGGKISLPLHSLGISASDNQFIRLKLETFACNNNFDNHTSFDQRFYMYTGANVVPKANDGDTPASVINHNYLTMPAYNTYTDVMADTVATIANLFQQNGYTTSDWNYSFTQIRGNGNQLNPMPSAYTTSPTNTSPNTGYDDLGYYRQNGVKCLTGFFTLTQNKTLYWGDAGSGVNVPVFDNTVAATSMALTSNASSDVYLLVGGRKAKVSRNLFNAATYELDPILAASPSGTQGQLLDLFMNLSTTGSGTAARTVITVSVVTVLRMQLQVENQIYLRSNLISTNYQTDNYNQREAIQASNQLSASNIFASFPINSNIIYYSANGADTFILECSQRTLPVLELFLTNRNGNSLSTDNPSVPLVDFNLSFQACIRIEVVERPVIASTAPDNNRQGLAPARLSGVATNQRLGQDTYLNNNFTRMAISGR